MDEIKDAYDQYLHLKNKSFNEQSFECFQVNWQFINEHNNAETRNYKLSPNLHIDKCDEELMSYFNYSISSNSIDMSPVLSSPTPTSNGLHYDSSVELNWASSSNNLGRSVMPSVQNQGSCGACWAFVAASTISASVAIHTDVKMELSAQELVDCDDVENKGCLGGNYYFAFKFVLANGITSALEYPFRMTKEACRKDSVTTRSSFTNILSIPPNDQESMKMHLQQYGPIAVGVCGRDKEFLFYRSGVFDLLTCCTELNHALVIVGYGNDAVSGLDYWLVQNSWGSEWGEGGFMRILRSSDTDSAGGVCQIAVLPAIPYGGYLTHGELTTWEITTNEIHENWKYLSLLLVVCLLLFGCGVFIAYIVEYCLYLYWPRRSGSSSEYVQLTVPEPAAYYSNIYKQQQIQLNGKNRSSVAHYNSIDDCNNL